MRFEFLSELEQAISQGGNFVLCTVIAAMGSSPAKPGQKMIVRSDGTIRGTVGGGVNEERIRRAALELFRGGDTRLVEFAMDQSIASDEPVCGGRFTCFLELLEEHPRLFIFGAGHVGAALARLAQACRFHVTVVDERAEFVSEERLAAADVRLCASYEDAVARCPIDHRSSVVIVTPGHVKDREVLERAILTEASYIGMIGSQRKWDELRQAMIAAGADARRLGEIHCPIGVNLVGQSPEEIALGVLAQVVAFRHGKDIPYCRD